MDNIDEIIEQIKQSNDISSSLKIINNALEINPENPRLLFELGRIYLKLKNVTKAKENFLKAHKLDKTDIYVMFELSKIYLRDKNNKDLKQGELLLDEILKIRPGDTYAIFEKARLLVKKGEYDEAEKKFFSLLYTRSHIHTKLELGKLYVKKKNREKAYKNFTQILYNNPNDKHARLELAKFYFHDGNNDEALNELEKILKIYPDDKVAKTIKGIIYSLMGLKEEAVELYRELSNDYKDDKDIEIKLITFLIENNDCDDAKDLIEQLLESNMDEEYKSKVKLELSHYYIKNGELDEAENVVKELLIQEPDSIRLNIRLANIYIRKHQKKEAEELLEKLYIKYPDDIYLKFELGKLYIKTDKINEAIKLFETLVNTLLSSNARYELVHAYDELGLLSKSYDIAKEIYDKSKGQVGLYDLAKIYSDKGNINKAIELIDLGLKNNKQNPYLKLLLGKIYAVQGNKEETINIFNELLKTKLKDKALTELIFMDIINEDFEGAFTKLSYKNTELDNSEQVESFIRYKLGMSIKKDESYFYNQLTNYSYEKFVEKMKGTYINKEADKIGSKFAVDNKIELYNLIDINDLNPVSRTIYDKYIIDLNKVVGIANNQATTKLAVITFSNDKNILMYYPISMEYGVSTKKNQKKLINKGVMVC